MYKGRSLYHPMKPLEQAEKRAAANPAEKRCIYLLPSPLLWYGVTAFLQRCGDNVLLIAVEHDQQLYELSCQYLSPELSSDPRLLFCSSDHFFQTLSSLDLSPYRRCALLSLNGGYSLNREVYRQLLSHCQRSVKLFWQNRMTMSCMAPLWLKNLFFNLALFTGRKIPPPRKRCNTVLIAGAGPSLDDALDLAYRHRSQLSIVAVDTALSSLKDAGIRPDYVVCQDAQFYTVWDYLPAGEALFYPHFIDLTASRTLASKLQGPVYPFVSRFSELALLDRLTSSLPYVKMLPPMGSVGITALYLAGSLAPRQILHCGLDFSYQLGRSHARSSPYHLLELRKQRRLECAGDYRELLRRHPFPLQQEDPGEPKIYSDLVLDSYYETFQEHSRRLSQQLGIEVSTLSNLRSSSIKAVAIQEGQQKREQVLRTDIVEGIAFLEGEKHLLECYLSGDHHLLSKLDYLYAAFPDYHRFQGILDTKTPDPSLRRRIRLSAQRYHDIIEKALTLRRS